MRLQELLAGQSALTQYMIMARADQYLTAGRYYGGALSAEHIELLTAGIKLKES